MKTENTIRAGDTLDIPRLCERLVASPGFGRAVLGLILFNAVLVGLETSADAVARDGAQLLLLSLAILGLFLLELAVRWFAHPSGGARFLRDRSVRRLRRRPWPAERRHHAAR